MGNDALYESTLEAMEAVWRALDAELHRQAPLQKRVDGLRRWYKSARAPSAPLLKRLVLASQVFYQLAVVAEMGAVPKMGLDSRLLLLDGALTPIAVSDDLSRTADRVYRGGSLLIRYLRTRQGDVTAELLDDAALRIAAARRTADPLPRLALAMEGVVEALVAWRR